MLGAMAGGDAIEILVALKDLSEAGFKKLEGNLKTVEADANKTNFSGFSKATKGVEKDAESAAGKEGGGGLLGMASGFLSLPGPVGLAALALGGVAAAGVAMIPISDKVEAQEKALATAFKDHGESLDKLKPAVDAAISSGEQYGFNADQTRDAITKLTEAGLNMTQVQAALPHVMDLARAKNIDLSVATDGYTSSVYGNARALKQYGIILPQVSTSAADVTAKTKLAHAASQALTLAQSKLTVVEDSLKGKHTLTAAEALKLSTAQQAVKNASDKQKAAQAALTLAQQGGVDKAARLKLVNDGLNKAIKDQRGSTTDLQKDQAKLSDTIERFATIVGPPMTKILGLILQGFSLLLDVINNVLSVLATLVGAVQHAISGPLGSLAHVLGSIGGAIGGVAGGVGGLLSHLPHLAAGGIAPGGLAMVGERGPELAMLPGGTRVYPSGTGPVSSGGSTVVHTHIYLDGREIADVVDHHLARRLSLFGTGARF